MPKTTHKPMVPMGWSRVELGAVLDERTSKVTPSGGDARPYIALEHMESGAAMLLGHDRADSATSNKTEFTTGDILFGKLRPKLRKCVLAPFDGVCSTDILALFPQNGTHGRFLAQLCHTHQVMGYAIRTASGTKMPRTSWDMLSMCPVLLPPPEEQAKIAAVLGAVDEAVERGRAVLAQTRTLRQALLHTLLTRGLPGRHTKFKTVRLGDIYAERSEKGIEGLPIMSVTANGLVLRSSVDRRVESDLEDEGHALVRKDDIAYNMMRMWQGVSGLADRDCLVSPAYVVCAPKKGIVPAYGAYLLKAPHVVHLLRLHSQGVHEDRLRLYYKHFAPIKVEIPDEDAQRSSVRMIASLDARVAAAETHLAGLERVTSALSAALLTGTIRVPVDGLSAPAAAPTKGEVGHG